jgi:hypothetical protein
MYLKVKTGAHIFLAWFYGFKEYNVLKQGSGRGETRIKFN